MTFGDPWVLLALPAAVAAVLAAARISARRSRAPSLRHADVPFAVAAARPAALPEAFFTAIWSLSAVALVLAAAAPAILVQVPVHRVRIVAAIDTSGSMAASDLRPTRAAAAAAALRRFVAGAPPGAAIGLVTFSGRAQTLLAPTRDPRAVDQAIAAIPAPNGATAIGDALDLSGRLLGPSGPREILLMTDGVSNRGRDPIAVAARLGAHGIRIEVVGIGTAAGAPMPGTTELAGFDESALRAYAASTRGRYASAATAHRLDADAAALARVAGYEQRSVPIGAALVLAAAIAAMGAWFAGSLLGRY